VQTLFRQVPNLSPVTIDGSREMNKYLRVTLDPPPDHVSLNPCRSGLTDAMRVQDLRAQLGSIQRSTLSLRSSGLGLDQAVHAHDLHHTTSNERMQPMAKGNSINTENHPRYPRYPRVTVQLIGRTGDFYPTVTAVQTAMRRAGVPLQELSNFYQDATTGDEDNLLRTCLGWVDVQVR
jgi:hypothetical protein